MKKIEMNVKETSPIMNCRTWKVTNGEDENFIAYIILCGMSKYKVFYGDKEMNESKIFNSLKDAICYTKKLFRGI